MKNPPDFTFVRPEDSVAFDPTEFQFAFAYAVEVAHAPATILHNPRDLKFSLKKGRKTQRYTFTDIPMNRLGMAMVQRFRDDKVKYFSFMWRWFAFIDLVHSNVLGDEFRQRAKSKDDPDNTALEPTATASLRFGLSDEDWMSLLHSQPGRWWPWFSFGTLSGLHESVNLWLPIGK